MAVSAERSTEPWMGQDSWLCSALAEARVDLPRTRDAPRLARRTMEHEAGSALENGEREIVDVLMSELVTNAVVHPGRPGGDNVILRFAVSPERIRVEVQDTGGGFSMEQLGQPRSGPGGYGLLMVDRSASRWGASDVDGNCVWFELDRGAPLPR
jgi:anti-sigma regulatory factor (Ser/Thr protein kinase)